MFSEPSGKRVSEAYADEVDHHVRMRKLRASYLAPRLTDQTTDNQEVQKSELDSTHSLWQELVTHSAVGLGILVKEGKDTWKFQLANQALSNLLIGHSESFADQNSGKRGSLLGLQLIDLFDEKTSAADFVNFFLRLNQGQPAVFKMLWRKVRETDRWFQFCLTPLPIHGNRKSCVINVVDTGIVVIPEQLEKLFKFNSRCKSEPRRHAGTGLGAVDRSRFVSPLARPDQSQESPRTGDFFLGDSSPN